MMPERESKQSENSAGKPLVAELQNYKEEFEANRRDAQDLVAGLDDKQFNWRPAAGRWSIAECLAHLNVAGQMYLPAIDRTIKRARATNPAFEAGPFRHGVFGKLFLRATEPPAKIKVKAPKLIAPLPEHLLAVVMPAFVSLHEQLDRRLRDANGLNLARHKVASPFSRVLSLSLGHAFALTAAHERRHLWQARQVKEEADFP
ncbi:MAG TPA: DinB family protein [Pyrinomonadaceae bacterium]|nr:DinB family protein [Pyrinomonadaceae bacterium]